MNYNYYKLSLSLFALFASMIVYGGEYSVQDSIQQKERIETPLPKRHSSEQILYRKGYTVSYNKDYKIPNWVAWHLTAEHATGSIPRPGNAWHEDEEVPEPRATLIDYRGRGWSRGHMCPAGDNKWDNDAI